MLYSFFQQTECLIRGSMTLLKVPFIFPKYFFCSQQATFINVGEDNFCSWQLMDKIKPEIIIAANFSFEWTKSDDFRNCYF